jgi:hypothetical protein
VKDGGFFLKDHSQTIIGHVRGRTDEEGQCSLTLVALAPRVTSQTQLPFESGELEELAVLCRELAHEARLARAADKTFEGSEVTC